MIAVDQRHSVSVAGVIVDQDDRCLIVQRCDNGHWEPPGGVLEVDEGVADGLQREVREETGLIVEPVALTGVYKNMRRGIVALVFRCRIAGGELTTNEEVCAFRWASRDEVRSLPVGGVFHPGARRTRLGPPARRATARRHTTDLVIERPINPAGRRGTCLGTCTGNDATGSRSGARQRRRSR